MGAIYKHPIAVEDRQRLKRGVWVQTEIPDPKERPWMTEPACGKAKASSGQQSR